jgi:hypothetical protein
VIATSREERDRGRLNGGLSKHFSY